MPAELLYSFVFFGNYISDIGHQQSTFISAHEQNKSLLLLSLARRQATTSMVFIFILVLHSYVIDRAAVR